MLGKDQVVYFGNLLIN